MNKEQLIHKAYQVLIDKIDVTSFESYLYKLVEENGLNAKSLLYDFVDINYRVNDYKKHLFNFINKECSEEELDSLRIYEESLKIIEAESDEQIYLGLNFFMDLYVGSFYEYRVIYELYILYYEMEAIENVYSSLTKEGLLKKVKIYSSKVLECFVLYRDNSDWKGFLNATIEVEKEEEKKKINKKPINSYNLAHNESFGTKLKSLIKGILGLR